MRREIERWIPVYAFLGAVWLIALIVKAATS